MTALGRISRGDEAEPFCNICSDHAEIGRGHCDFDGKIPLHLDDGCAQFIAAHMGPNGVID